MVYNDIDIYGSVYIAFGPLKYRDYFNLRLIRAGDRRRDAPGQYQPLSVYLYIFYTWFSHSSLFSHVEHHILGVMGDWGICMDRELITDSGWASAGPVMRQCWVSAGPVPKQSWSSIGSVSAQCLSRVGSVLIRC